jgi:hypothetical protein
MITNLVEDVVSAFKDHYDSELTVIVNNKYIDEFLPIIKRYSVKTQMINESDHCVVVAGMKYKNYLKFMRTLQYEHAMNLTENVTINGSTNIGLIKEVISWIEEAA